MNVVAASSNRMVTADVRSARKRKGHAHGTIVVSLGKCQRDVVLWVL